MAGDAGLALSESLCEFAHGKLEVFEQTHDAQTGWVCKGIQGRFELHVGRDMLYSLYVQISSSLPI